MCVIFDCGHHHLESCLSTSPLTCDLAGLSKSKHGGFFACLFVCLFCFVSVFAGAIVCDHLSHAVILSRIKKCRSNSKPQILKAHSRLYPFSFLATVVSDENEF